MATKTTAQPFPPEEDLPTGVRNRKVSDLLVHPFYALWTVVRIVLLTGEKGSLLRISVQIGMVILAAVLAVGVQVNDGLDGWISLGIVLIALYLPAVGAFWLTTLRGNDDRRTLFTPSGKALLGMRRKDNYWVASSHIAVKKHEGAKLRKALGEILDTTSVQVRLTAANEKVASLYKTDFPDIKFGKSPDDPNVTGKRRFGRYDMHIPARN